MNKTAIKNFKKMVTLVKRRARRRKYWDEYWEANKDMLLIKKAERYYTDPNYREYILRRTKINGGVQSFLNAITMLYEEAQYEDKERTDKG
jgi:hypothetical protein